MTASLHLQPRRSQISSFEAAHYSPMAVSSTIASTHRRCKRLIDLTDEVSDKIVGPMPVQDFLQEFLPYSSAPPQPLKSYQEEMHNILGSKDEQEMYGPVANAIQTLCHNFSVIDAHNKPFPVFHKMKITPDLCIYRKNDTEGISTVEMMITAKYRSDCDPFLDPPGTPLVNLSELPSQTLGQITCYASAHHAAQFRSYIFSLLVFPTYVRILRWDRSGVIVTNRIPWSSADLPEFFHRFDCMTAEQRGVDPTVTKPSSSNETRARKMFQIGNNVTLMQLSVGGSEYILPAWRGPYMDSTCSPLSRTTRSFFAYSLSKQKFVFLKDSWRLESPTAEYNVYTELKKHQVPHIATVLAGEDVLGRQTRTQDIAEKNPSWAKNCPKCLRKLSHYRLVLEEIGSPLWTFSSTKMLVKVIHDALIAHKAAYERANILHRDISLDNILIYEGSALLIDWNLSKRRNDIEKETEPERIGTWQFRADRLLNFPVVEPHMLLDDIESFIHVITWTAFKYADHDMSKQRLTHFFRTVYDCSFSDGQGHQVNYSAKSRFLRVPIELEETKFKSKNLKELLLHITDIVSTRYRDSPLTRFLSWRQWKLQASSRSIKLAHDARELAEHGEEIYQENLTALKSSDWIIQRFSHALSKDNWPENDAAEEHKLVSYELLTDQDEGDTGNRKVN